MDKFTILFCDFKTFLIVLLGICYTNYYPIGYMMTF